MFQITFGFYMILLLVCREYEMLIIAVRTTKNCQY